MGGPHGEEVGGDGSLGLLFRGPGMTKRHLAVLVIRIVLIVLIVVEGLADALENVRGQDVSQFTMRHRGEFAVVEGPPWELLLLCSIHVVCKAAISSAVRSQIDILGVLLDQVSATGQRQTYSFYTGRHSNGD